MKRSFAMVMAAMMAAGMLAGCSGKAEETTAAAAETTAAETEAAEAETAAEETEAASGEAEPASGGGRGRIRGEGCFRDRCFRRGDGDSGGCCGQLKECL